MCAFQKRLCKNPSVVPDQISKVLCHSNFLGVCWELKTTKLWDQFEDDDEQTQWQIKKITNKHKS